MRSVLAFLVAFAPLTLVAKPAGASFHLMQIEQVIGGVNGHTDIQAIQLRMRSTFPQNLVSQGRLVVRNATGSNPVLLIDFTQDVLNGALGDRVLAATSNFSATTTTDLVPDAVLTNPIPPSYLPAGSLTWEDDFGTVYWRLSWGGATYTGLGTGSTLNDPDGVYSPPFAGPLPSTTQQALLFRFAASAQSTNNANDYALTTGAAIFTNNFPSSGTIKNIVGVGDGASGGSLALSAPTPNPVRSGMTYDIVLPRSAGVQVHVLDVGGRVVRKLVDQTLPAGHHSYTWDALDDDGPVLSSGLYFLELTADGARTAQRFTFIR